MREIRPQAGPQEAFLATPADIAIYGGAAFGGKTYGLLLDPLHYVEHGSFGAVIFRRTSPQIFNQGGLWDTAEQIYPLLGAEGLRGLHQWRFPSGAKITFAHLQLEKDKLSWQGPQIPYIGFDEICQFTEGQFWYLVSRNRDPSGKVAPHIRGTCNPDPDSFVAKLIDWWIDEKGIAIPERSGQLRWFIRHHDALVWADTPEELRAAYPQSNPKSLTFIASCYEDNPAGLAADPGYLANLDNLPRVERERLKAGNWKVRPAGGDYFQSSTFRVIEPAEIPHDCRWVRYWDRAATIPSDANPDPDWTAGALVGKSSSSGEYVIAHCECFRDRPTGVMTRIHNIAKQDGRGCTIGIEQDPGQAGVAEAGSYVRELAGWTVKVVVASGSKEVRAGPLSSQAGQGRVALVRGDWNAAFLAELESFPRGKHDDQVDAASGAFNLLESVAPWAADWTPARTDAGWNGRADDQDEDDDDD